MQMFRIGPMRVTREEFKHQLKKLGLKFGYVKNLYEKWTENGLTFYRIVIEDTPYIVITDEENCFPEISGTSKKIEPYSFEWLVELEERARLCGPSFYEVLLRELQTYIRIQKAGKSEKCEYCETTGSKAIRSSFNSDYGFRIDGDEMSFVLCERDGCRVLGDFEINCCPMCGRKLEA